MNDQLERSDEILSEDATVTISLAVKRSGSSRSKTKRHSPLFRILICLYAVLLVVGIGFGLYRFNTALKAYQQATPTEVLNQYLHWVETRDFEALFVNGGYEETLLNSKKEYVKRLEQLYAGEPDTITLQEQIRANDEYQLYTVCFDDKPVAVAQLTNTEDGWQITTILEPLAPYTVYVGSDMNVTLNGDNLTLLGVPCTTVSDRFFSGASSADAYPDILQYTISGLLNPPTIEALTLSGIPCSLIADSNDPQILYIRYVPAPTEQETMESVAADMAFQYTAFLAKDAKREDVLANIYPETVLYQQVTDYDNSGFEKHTAYEFQDLKVFNSCWNTEDDFSCEITFQPVYTYKKKTFEGEAVHYRLTLLKVEDEWKLLSLVDVEPPASSENTDKTQTEEP